MEEIKIEDEKVEFYVRVSADKQIVTYLNTDMHEIKDTDIPVSFEDYGYALSINANFLDANNKPIRIDSAEIVKPYITPISMRQCRLKLLKMNLLELVETEMAKDKTLSIEWEYATEITIDNPLVLMLSEKLGLSEEARIKMFEEARLL
jgi:hypothetical protein